MLQNIGLVIILTRGVVKLSTNTLYLPSSCYRLQNNKRKKKITKLNNEGHDHIIHCNRWLSLNPLPPPLAHNNIDS